VTASLGDNRSYHGITGATPDYGALLPLFVRQILLVGEDLAADARTLQQRPGLTVYGYSSNTDAVDGLSAILPPDDDPFPLPAGYLDAVVVVEPSASLAALFSRVERLISAVQADGLLVATLPHLPQDEIAVSLQHAGWKLHHYWELGDGKSDTSVLITAHRVTYEPRAHASRLAKQRRPDAAYDVLYLLPERYMRDASERASVALESMEYLGALPIPSDWPSRLERFARAQWLFSQTAAQFAVDERTYRAFATCCDITGHSDLRNRVMRTVDSTTFATMPLGIPKSSYPNKRESTDVAPQNPSTGRLVRRVLILMRQQMDYGQDVLYDGLCELLGDENVVDYPYKGSLHEDPDKLADGYYPCVFFREGQMLTHESVREQIQGGLFDLILFADGEHTLAREEVIDLVDANRDIPIAIVDQDDTPCDPYRALSVYLDRVDIIACFKREKLEDVPYHPNITALPFGYPASRIPAWRDGPRDIPVAWAGNRKTWMREAYLIRLEQLLSTKLGKQVSQDDYAAQLQRTQIAPCFFGGGFDTVRYWEIPAHGALLLAERPPIEIPHNFVDGQHAVFFDDIQELQEKVGFYLEHPEECRRIARGGYEHLREHHTGTARARRLLDNVEARLGGSTP
jgi:hypothetical protein